MIVVPSIPAGNVRISIITTCLNSRATIGETIESILTQEGPFEVEYIVTDAGSTDGTRELVQGYFPRIHLIDASGLNQAAGINLGFREATGEILAFLNADDCYLPGTLSRVVETFQTNPQAEWLVGQARIIDEDGVERTRWISQYKNLLLRFYSYPLLLLDNFIPQPAVFLRRSLLDLCGMLEESEELVMDYEYWLRVGREHRPVLLRQDLALFRRTQSTKSNQFFVQQFRDDLRIASDYARRNGYSWLTPFKRLLYLRTVLIYSLLYR